MSVTSVHILVVMYCYRYYSYTFATFALYMCHLNINSIMRNTIMCTTVAANALLHRLTIVHCKHKELLLFCKRSDFDYVVMQYKKFYSNLPLQICSVHKSITLNIIMLAVKPHVIVVVMMTVIITKKKNRCVPYVERHVLPLAHSEILCRCNCDEVHVCFVYVVFWTHCFAKAQIVLDVLRRLYLCYVVDMHHTHMLVSVYL